MTAAPRLRSSADAALQAAYQAGRRAHPRLDLPYGAFLSRRVGAGPPKAPGDYYLARACDASVSGAWERLQSLYQRRLLAFLRRRGARRELAESLLEETWGALAAPPARGGADTAIGTYDGRGSLHAWLATVLWRRLTDHWRARSADGGPEPSEGETAHPERDPATRVADAETARRLALALEEAWANLTPRELQAVVLKYRHQLPQTEIAAILAVSPPRVTRLLQAAATRLRVEIESRLGAQPEWNTEGAGWARLFEALERILARASAVIELPLPGRVDDA